MIILFGGKLFLEELKTWKLTKADRPKRKPAAIILIVNALLMIKPPYKLIERIIPDIHKIIRDIKPM